MFENLGKDPHPIDLSFTNICQILSNGYTQIHEWVWALLIFIALLDLFFCGIQVAAGVADTKKETMERLLNYAFWILAITIFPYFMLFISELFSLAGLAAGGYKSEQVPLPVTILMNGLKQAEPIFKYAEKIDIWDFGSKFFYLLCWVAMIFAYVKIIITFVLSYAEFAVLVGIGGLFMPFGLLKQTRFLPEKFLGSATGHGIKLLLLNFILASSDIVLANVDGLLTDLSIDHIVASIAIVFLFMVLVENIPQMATGLLAGSPTLSNNSLGGAAIAAGAAVMMGGRALKAMGQGALTGSIKAGGGIAKAMGAAKSYRDAYKMNADQAGILPTKRGLVASSLKGAGGSLVGSFGSSLKSGAKGLFNRAVHGSKAKHMPQLRNPDSLENIGKVGEFLDTRFNQGLENEKNKSAADKSGAKKIGNESKGPRSKKESEADFLKNTERHDFFNPETDFVSKPALDPKTGEEKELSKEDALKKFQELKTTSKFKI